MVCAFFRPQNTSEILNYELFVYLQNLFAVYRTVILLERDHDIVGYQVSDLLSKDIRTVELASDWLKANLGTAKSRIGPFASFPFQTPDNCNNRPISIY